MNKVVCAFPGLGKTFLSRVNPHFLDLDFVQYKSMSREDALVRYAQDILFHPLRTVLINDPFVISYLKNRDVIVVLPTSKMDLLNRIKKRGDEEFAVHLEMNYDRWIREWMDCALSNKCKIIKTPGYLRDVTYMWR